MEREDTRNLEAMTSLVLTMATRRLMDVFGDEAFTDPELRLVDVCLWLPKAAHTASAAEWYHEVKALVVRAARRSPSCSERGHRPACPLCGDRGHTSEGYGSIEHHLRRCPVWMIFDVRWNAASQKEWEAAHGATAAHSRS